MPDNLPLVIHRAGVGMEMGLRGGLGTSSPALASPRKRRSSTSMMEDGHSGLNASQSKTDSAKVNRLLEIQLVLKQLKIPAVRGDFLAGRILKIDNPLKTLFALDAMYKLFFPSWSSDGVARQAKIGDTMHHLEKLCARSKKIFHLSCDGMKVENFSYDVWNSALNKLLVCSYWSAKREKLNLDHNQGYLSDEGVKSESKVPVRSRFEDDDGSLSDDGVLRGRMKSRKMVDCELSKIEVDSSDDSESDDDSLEMVIDSGA